jgi:hypothetical protein
MSGRYAPRLSAAPIMINVGETTGSISSKAVKKEEPAKNGDTRKNGGIDGCESASGAAWRFLTNNIEKWFQNPI